MADLDLTRIGMNVGHFEETWRPADAAHMKRLLSPFGIVRFMDWQRTNASLVRDTLPTAQSLEQYREKRRRGVGAWKDKHGNWVFQGLPLADIITLSNQWGVRPWMCIPHLATPGLIRHMLSEVINKCHHKPIIEFSNEIWNTNPEFRQHPQSAQLGIGVMTAEWRKIAKEQFMDKQPSMMHALSFQAHRTIQLDAELKKIGRHRATLVVGSQMYNPQISKYLLALCGHVVDGIAVAPYIGGLGREFNKALYTLLQARRDGLGPQLKNMLRAKVEFIYPEMNGWEQARKLEQWRKEGEFGKALHKNLQAENQALARQLYEKILHEEIVTGRFADRFEKNAALCREHGVKQMGYECGLHLMGEHFTDFCTSAGAGRITRLLLTEWQRRGGDLICLYSLASHYHGGHFWGHVEISHGNYEVRPRMVHVLM